MGEILEENQGEADEEEFLEQVSVPTPMTTPMTTTPLPRSKCPWDKFRVDGHMFRFVIIQLCFTFSEAATSIIIKEQLPSS